jgi:hypothetical protein
MSNLEIYFNEFEEVTFLICVKLEITNVDSLSQCSKILYNNIVKLKNNELFWIEVIESEYKIILPNEVKYCDINSPHFMKNKYKLLHSPINIADIILHLIKPLKCDTARQEMIKLVKSDPKHCAMNLRGMNNMTYFENQLISGGTKDIMLAYCIIPDLISNIYFIQKIVTYNCIYLVNLCIERMSKYVPSDNSKKSICFSNNPRDTLVSYSIYCNKVEILEILLNLDFFEISRNHIISAIKYKSEETLNLLLDRVKDIKLKNYGATLKIVRDLYLTENIDSVMSYIKDNNISIEDVIIVSVEFDLEEITQYILRNDLCLSADAIDHIYNEVKYFTGNAKLCLLEHPYWKNRIIEAPDCLIN